MKTNCWISPLLVENGETNQQQPTTQPATEPVMTGETAIPAEDPPRVQTYAFLDLESTDLMTNRPRITELSIVAVHAEDMLAAGVLPRVTNRLTLCFNPRKPISPGSSSITGLYNDNLELQSTFSVESTTLLNNFFDHLAQPVCLVAHFGNGFDYPLLAAELKRINQSLTPSLMCVDSLEVFRVLDGLPPRHDPANRNQANAPSPIRQPQSSISSPATPLNYTSALEVPCAPQKRKVVNEDSTSPCRQSKLLKNDIETCSIGLHSETIKIQQNTTTGKVRKRLFNGEDTAEIKEASEQLKENEADIEFTSSLEDDDYMAFADEVEKEFGLKDAIRSVSEKTEKNKNESEELCNVPEPTIDLTQHSLESFPSSEPSIAKCLDPPNCESKTFDQTNTCSTVHFTQQGKRKHGGDVNAGTGYLVRNANSDSKSGNASNTEDKSNSKADNIQPTLMNVKEISNTKEGNTPQAEVVANNQADSSGTRDDPLLNVDPSPGCRQNGANHGTPSKSLKSFKLKDIHQRIFGCLPQNSHRAEDDCITLLKVAKCTPGFIDCVASRIVPFSTIQPPVWARSRPSP